MIANVEGRLSAVEKDAVVVQVGGIGVRVYVPKRLLAQCGPGGGIPVGSDLEYVDGTTIAEALAGRREM